MRTTKLRSIAVILLAAAACAASGTGSSPRTRPRPTAEGYPVVVVLRDVSPPSQRATFTLAGASAVGEDGSELRLDAAPEASGALDPASPRVWLTGFLPQGTYTGLRLTIGSASRTQPLEVEDGPLTIQAPFAVSPRAGAVLRVELRSTGGEPGTFAPDFAAAVPGKIAAGLLGMATVGAWDAVALFDKRAGDLVAVLPTGRRPAGVAVDPARGRAYVAVEGEDAVTVIDLFEYGIEQRVDLRAGDEPREVAAVPGGNLVLVANSGSDTVSFVDVDARVEIERVPVASRPVSLIVDRSGRRAFVVAERGSAVTVLDVASRSVVGSLTTETGPILARFGGRNQELVYVAHGASPYLTVHDAASFATLSRIDVGLGTVAFEVDPRSDRLFVARKGTGKIEVFEPRTLLPSDAIPIPGPVAYFAVESEGDALGVLLKDPGEVRTIGIVSRREIARTRLGPGPSALRFVETR